MTEARALDSLQNVDLDSIRFDFNARPLENLAELEQARIDFLGKKGRLAALMSLMGQLSPDERKSFGASINLLKEEIEARIIKVKAELEQKELAWRLEREALDVTLAPREYKVGTEHPISRTLADVQAILEAMGFTLAEGPEIEDDWHNFSALNVPPSHPARQMQDTFYLKDSEMLLRTHTSSVQIRYMTGKQPPFKIISLGKVYRSDYDATHTPMFHQVEGLYIAESLHMGHLKAHLQEFLSQFFEVKELPIRLRPSYFPFVEPGAEVDVRCEIRDGKVTIGQGNDWVEILGCGMVHPKVLTNVGVDPSTHQGFAFGMGIERLAMLKYGIPDIRRFFENDFRWLKQL
jgi:phenylalanyl-tRNA synthetase alpha chain